MAETAEPTTLERARRSRFAQEIVGPRVARPLGAWLQTALDLDEGEPGVADPDQPPVIDDPPPIEEPAPPAGPHGFKAVALAVKDRLKDHNLVVVAAGIAFWGLLAIPAVLFSLVSIGGLVFDADTIKEQVEEQMDGAPEEVTAIISEQFESVAATPSGGLITGLILGIVVALWTASGAMAKLMGTLNAIYDVKETRKFVKLRGTALAMTLGGVVFMVAAIFVLAALPPILSRIDGVGPSAAWLFSLATYPILGLVMVLGLGVLYRWGPDRKDRYRPINRGAVVATVLWVLAVVGFSVYTTTAATYNETYGSLGGLVMLLLFLLITALTVLIGAEVHAILRLRNDPANAPSISP